MKNAAHLLVALRKLLHSSNYGAQLDAEMEALRVLEAYDSQQAAQGDRVSKEQAIEALDSMDDYARMEIGVDAMGPRECLRRFIEQQVEPAQAVMRCASCGSLDVGPD